MKNLQAIIRRNIKFESETVSYCVDSDNGILYVLTKELRLFKAQIYSEDTALDEKSLKDQITNLIGVTSINQNDVKLFELVVEIGGLLLALKSGHLLIIYISSIDCQCIYKHYSNISSISLSPSQDLIALADDKNDIQIMYCPTCDIIHNSNALTQNESLHKPVGVGWGSKETQFFGLDGRPSQEKQQSVKIELHADEVAISDQIEGSEKFREFQHNQERTTIIDWRGDGQLIATLTFLPDSQKHYIKVWNRNLELQYMSEQLVTVERGLLCWIPDGRYICCAQRRERRLNEIALFEKNGLVRQRISLPSMMSDMYISNMAWSPDSKILAIIVKQFHIVDTKIQFDNILMLYTMQNWHYYLKSSIQLRNDCGYSMKWDAASYNRLHVMSSDGFYIEYDCCFQVSYSDQYSTVAVVDGNKVLMTPLETCVLPPPISAITLEAKNLIYRLAIDHLANIYIVTLNNQLIRAGTSDEVHAGDVALKIDLHNRVAQKLNDCLRDYQVFNLNEANHYQHLIPIDNFSLIASKITPTGSEIIKLSMPKFQKLEIETLKTFDKRQVICIARNTTRHCEGVNIILNDSSCLWLNLKGEVESSLDFQPAESRFSYNIIESQALISDSRKSVISLAKDYCLRFNKDVLASNCCTSFRTTENYLIYTTSENNINFILLTSLLDNTTAKTCDSWSQQIENGGTLITASENDSKVVLQMPRGNLETIHPRVLLLSRLTVLLDEKEYVEACKLARRHRVNMNFLIDYLSRLNVDYKSYWTDFAIAVANHDPNLLCLIITELDNDDTISGRYQSIIKLIPTRRADFSGKFKISNKVNEFCSHIDLPKKQEFLYPKIQCLLRMEPKLTSDALKIVHTLEQDLKADAIKYILYFVDVDQLFKDALSTYNTDIALMVASASNKDPKQYLTLLDEFSKIENESYRYYEIDMHIKRYDRAFNHLYSFYQKSVAEDIDEHHIENLLQLVVTKRIYNHAICHLQSLEGQACTYGFELDLKRTPNGGDALISRIWSKYAEYLLEKRHYGEAGLAYSKTFTYSFCLDRLNSALKCYSFIEDWERSMALVVRCIRDQHLKRHDLSTVTSKLVKQLVERGKFQEAILIQQLTSKDFETKLEAEYYHKMLTSGNWYLVEIFSGDDFPEIAKHVDLLKQANSLVEDLKAEMKKAQDQFERLQEVLITQQIRQESVLEKGLVSDTLSTVDGSELSSISESNNSQQQIVKVARSGATSIKTRSSIKSNKSTNKRINLKIGSRHEDIALVLELKKFILKLKANNIECSNYTSLLFEYLVSTERANNESKKFIHILEKSHELAQQIVEVLWPPPHLEHCYSLYRRFTNIMSTETPENIDFEVLIRPELSKPFFDN